MSTDLALRGPKQEDDFRFVLRSWVRCFSKSTYAGPYSRQRLSQVIRGTALDLLNRESTVCTFGVNPLNADQIWGFICHERGRGFPLVHFVYVKELFRGVGIGSRLLSSAREGLEEEMVRFTHKTPASRKFFRKCGASAKFSPALARFEQENSETSTAP